MSFGVRRSPVFSTPRWRRRARIAALVLVAALATVGTMIGSTLPDFSANNGASSVPAGLFVASQSPTDVLALGQQLGVTPTIMTVYADGSCYCTYSDPPSTSMTLMLGVGALTAAQATSIGQSLVAAGQSNAIIRVMWEQNQDVGGWFPSWNQSALTSSQYIATFQTIVTTMRAVPGEGFRFMWNPNGGTGNEAPGRTWKDTWPGSNYVNYVGIDQYDYSGYAANIQAVIAFAQSQGLPTAIPEWGLDGSDDPSYITSVANLVRDAANNVAFQCYFSYGGGNTDSEITQFPNSEAAYRAAFDATTPTTGPPPTPVSPTTTVSPPTTVPPSTTGPTGSPPHVMVVVMENKNYTDVIGQSTQPVTNSLATGYGLATQSYALFHPSLPNYLDLVSGSNQGVTVDEPPSSSGIINRPTLATQLATAGFSVKAYAENLPTDPTNDSGEYAVRHFPWEYFASPLTGTNSSQLTTDLNAATPPDFVWYTPNLVNDEHDGSVQQGDSFLASFIPAVQATGWYRSGGQIVITWDESASDNTNGGGRVPTIVVSDRQKANPAQSSSKVDTTGILHSIEDTYGLPHLGGSSADGSIDSLLTQSTPSPPTTTTTSPPTTTPPTTTVPPTTTTSRPPTTPPTTAPSTTTTTSLPPTTPPTTVPSTTSPPPTSPPAPPPTTVPSLQPTVTTVTMAPDQHESRQVLTATVSPAPDGGTVAFSVDGQGLAEPVPVGHDGTAVTSVDLADGPHPVTATYSGTSEFASSSVDLVLAVGQAPTALTTSAPSLSSTGTQYVLSATLTSAGSPIVGALVSFTALGSPLCQSTTDTEGSATCSIDTDPSQAPFLATTGYTATFEGDPTHLPASSHSPIFGGKHWRGRHRHPDDSQWRRPADADPTFLDSGRPSWPTSESTSPPTVAPGTAPATEPGAKVAIAETSTVTESGSGYVVGLFVLLGMILCTAILRRRRLVWTGPRPWRRHPR